MYKKRIKRSEWRFSRWAGEESWEEWIGMGQRGRGMVADCLLRVRCSLVLQW